MITVEGLLSECSSPGMAVKQSQHRAITFQPTFVNYDGAVSIAACLGQVSAEPSFPHPSPAQRCIVLISAQREGVHPPPDFYSLYTIIFIIIIIVLIAFTQGSAAGCPEAPLGTDCKEIMGVSNRESGDFIPRSIESCFNISFLKEK